MKNAFLDGKYIILFNGHDQGVIECSSAETTLNVLRELFPNAGCPTYAILSNPAKWETGSDDAPYFVEVECEDDGGISMVRVYRVKELES